jgi:hypothetical protein
MASKTRQTKESKSSAGSSALPIVTDPEMAERFERELAWCIGQLECMMRSSSSSSKDKDPRKFCYLFSKNNHSSRLARSAIQVLTNPKASFIRKRQMMQQLFGDYRQKMKEEEDARQKRLLFLFV